MMTRYFHFLVMLKGPFPRAGHICESVNSLAGHLVLRKIDIDIQHVRVR